LNNKATPRLADVPAAQNDGPSHGAVGPAPSLHQCAASAWVAWCVSCRAMTCHGPACRTANNAASKPASSLSPRTKRKQQQQARAQKAAFRQTQQQQQRQQQQQQQQTLHTAFHSAASVDSMPPANRLVLGRPLDPVLDLGCQRGRAGLGHSAPTLMDLDPQQRAAAQVSSGSLLTPATAPMQATDGPSTSVVPTPPLPLSLRLMAHPCCQQCLCWCPQTFLTLQCPLPCAYGRRMSTYPSTLPSKQSSMCMPTVHQSSASIPQQIALACQSRCRRSWSQQSEQSLVMHRSTCCMAQTHGQTLRSSSSHGQHSGRQPLHANHISNGNYGSPQTVRQAAQTSRRVLEMPSATPGGAQ